MNSVSLPPRYKTRARSQHLLESASGKINADSARLLFESSVEFVQHYDTLRMQSAFATAATAGIIASVWFQGGGLGEQDLLWPGIAFTLIGVLGFLLTAYYADVLRFHWQQMDDFRNLLIGESRLYDTIQGLRKAAGDKNDIAETGNVSTELWLNNNEVWKRNWFTQARRKLLLENKVSLLWLFPSLVVLAAGIGLLAKAAVVSATGSLPT